MLVEDGRVVQKNLDHELLTEGDLIKMLRQQGIDRIADARLAVLDTEGSLTVARLTPQSPAHAGSTSN